MTPQYTAIHGELHALAMSKRGGAGFPGVCLSVLDLEAVGYHFKTSAPPDFRAGPLNFAPPHTALLGRSTDDVPGHSDGSFYH